MVTIVKRPRVQSSRTPSRGALAVHLHQHRHAGAAFGFHPAGESHEVAREDGHAEIEFVDLAGDHRSPGATRRGAAKNAEQAIEAISVPPNSVPMWLVSPGETTSREVASVIRSH